MRSLTSGQIAIHGVRMKLPGCVFDEAACSAGILHLENYSRDWDEKLAVWRSHPRHDEHSHGADAFMTFTDGYVPPVNGGSWKFTDRKVV